MKILQINKFYYRRRGAETYLFDLIDLLERQGHEVAVFAMEHPQNMPTPWSKYFVSTVDYSKKNLKAAARMFWSTEAQRQLEKLLQDFKPDVAHVHNIYHQISPSILTTLKKHNIPIVQTLHDYKIICPNYEMFTQGERCERCRGHSYTNAITHRCLKNSTALSTLAAMEMYFHKFLKVYEKNVDCFISPSQFLKDKIRSWQEPLRRIEVLPNFIDTATITPSYQYDKYFLYAGGISEIKGVRLLLDIFQKNHYDLALYLAGDGSDLVSLKQSAESNSTIKFLGRLPQDQLFSVLDKAYAVIVPSRHDENFPYSVLEAFAYGKAVIGSQRGGIPELVGEETGWLFEPDQPITLTTALQAAASDVTAVQRRGKAARRLAEQRLDPKTHYDRLLEIYTSVINQ